MARQIIIKKDGEDFDDHVVNIEEYVEDYIVAPDQDGNFKMYGTENNLDEDHPKTSYFIIELDDGTTLDSRDLPPAFEVYEENNDIKDKWF